MNMRADFDEMIRDLNAEILKMGTLVEEAIQKVVIALTNCDLSLAEEIINGDTHINGMEIMIEDFCIRIIATKQPVAGDLRNIITCMKIASQLERMADHAVHIAKNVVRLKECKTTSLLAHIPRTGEILVDMVHDVLTAFINQDADKAMEIAGRDKEIDDLHYKSMSEIISCMIGEQETVADGIGYLFTDYFFERLGDHVTNICEWIVYNKTCEHRELKSKDFIWHREPFL
ncbi:MAG: phosphate signaling complex protein PhoU [Spirochaetales bacterium]|nr:phosphate signaling complex protein PhoU [Spirochaetales bacterium]